MAITKIDVADFSLNVNGITRAALTSVSRSGSTRTMVVGNGTLRLNLIDNNTILDAGGNPLGGHSNYTAG